MASPSESAADTVVALARRRDPTLGATRLICVDGPAGSGKTTLAKALAGATGGAVIHMDDLYDGWRGMDALHVQLPTILGPLAAGRPGSYRRYDWTAGEYAETVTVEPAAWLILEGVGSGTRRHEGLRTVLVHLNAPPGLRLERGLARDGEDALPHWRRWMVDEAEMFAREEPSEHADILLDGSGRWPTLTR